MKDELKAQLDGLFKKVAEKEQQIKIERDVEAEARANFLQAFLDARDELHKPALQQFAEYVAPHGWKGVIKTDDGSDGEFDHRARGLVNKRYPSITIEFLRDNYQASYGESYPHFAMTADAIAKKISFHESTIGPGHGGRSGGEGSATLAEVDADFIHARLVKFFTKLLGDAGPRR